jgi:hypothetical protein
LVNSKNGKIAIEGGDFVLTNKSSEKTIKFTVLLRFQKNKEEKSITLQPGGKAELLSTVMNYNNLLKQISINKEQVVNE